MNRWTGTGHLTRDPELRATGGGTDICLMRIAVSGPPGTAPTAIRREGVRGPGARLRRVPVGRPREDGARARWVPRPPKGVDRGRVQRLFDEL
jgi:hypothetical protein